MSLNVTSPAANLSLESLDANLKVLMLNTDSFFLVVMGIIVFLMQCGFAFLEAGAVR
jgi:Amt family ammonium transporter